MHAADVEVCQTGTLITAETNQQKKKIGTFELILLKDLFCCAFALHSKKKMISAVTKIWFSNQVFSTRNSNLLPQSWIHL